MSRDRLAEAGIEVIDHRGSHLLIRHQGRWAVIEWRAGEIYGLDAERRQGFPPTAEGIAAAVGEGWREEAAARAVLDELSARGDQLAQRLW